MSLDSAVVVAGWCAAWLLLWRLPDWRATPSPERPRVSVVVPARNEEHNLPHLLRSLDAQTSPADEVIVVDDHSTDDTARIAAESDVEVLASADLPSAWTGKSWACWQGARAASGDVLVFLDADVELGDDALGHGVTEQAARGGLLSVQPIHDVGSPVESLSLPFNVVALMGLGIGSVVPPRVEQAAAGPFMVCRRDDYVAVDGHRAVADEIVEDLALARRFAAAGLPVTCLAGVDDVRFRMYRGGLSDIVSGWSKNFATGARFTPLGRASAIALWITASLTAAWGIAGAVLAGGWAMWVGGAVYLAFAAQYATLGRRAGRFGPAAVVWPVLIAFFTGVFAWSLVATFVLRRVRWRDRSVPIRRRTRAVGQP